MDDDHVECPYCERPVKRTVDWRNAVDRKLFGEHCDNCFLPFGVDAEGRAIHQDDDED